MFNNMSIYFMCILVIYCILLAEAYRVESFQSFTTDFNVCHGDLIITKQWLVVWVQGNTNLWALDQRTMLLKPSNCELIVSLSLSFVWFNNIQYLMWRMSHDLIYFLQFKWFDLDHLYRNWHFYWLSLF